MPHAATRPACLRVLHPPATALRALGRSTALMRGPVGRAARLAGLHSHRSDSCGCRDGGDGDCGKGAGKCASHGLLLLLDFFRRSFVAPGVAQPPSDEGASTNSPTDIRNVPASRTMVETHARRSKGVR